MRRETRFARGYLQVELEELMANPFGRPLGWVIIISGLAVSAAVACLLSNGAMHWLVAAGIGLLIGYAYVILALLPLTLWLEQRHFARAPRSWLVEDADGLRGAYVRDRDGAWWLYSVFARPRGSGLGTRLLRAICSEADETGHDIVLMASNRRAARFYERAGFVHCGRRVLGHRMRRSAREPEDSMPDMPKNVD